MWSDDPAKAEATLDELVRRMSVVLGEHLVSTRGESLEQIVAQLLTENHATIAVAESCTGGLLAERLTSVAGSSAYFLGGVVCYSNELKTSMAGVPPELIEAKGAVSAEVALALASRNSQTHRRDARSGRHRHRRAGRRDARKARRAGTHRHRRRAQRRKRRCFSCRVTASASASSRRSAP